MDTSERAEVTSQVNGLHCGAVPSRKPVPSQVIVLELALKPDLHATVQLCPVVSALHCSESSIKSAVSGFAQGFPTQLGIAPV